MIDFRICAKHHTTAYLEIFTTDIETFLDQHFIGEKKKEFNSCIYMPNKNTMPKPFFTNKQLLF